MTKTPVALCGVAALSLVSAVNGAAIFTGATLSETFDGLPTASVSSFLTGTKATVTGTVFDAVDSDGSGSSTLTADNGSSNAGGIHSYGTGTATDRALGSLGSGSVVPAYGVEIQNGSTGNITSLTVSFVQENWRPPQTTVNTTTASYAVGTSGSANYLTVGTGLTFTAAPTLNLVSGAAVAAQTPTDGNLAANQVAHTLTIVFATPITSGQSFYLRFMDPDEASGDAGFGIDTFVVTGVVVAAPEPTTLAALGGAASLFLRRRRV